MLEASTGLAGLDHILHGLIPGDNVVWQVDDISDYKKFVKPFVQKAILEKRRIVYIRFAEHEKVVDEKQVKVHRLDPGEGFEPFSAKVHNIIKEEGKGVFYVFDCLSDLQTIWATDLMIGNFFMITCPFLYELDTIAYFALLRRTHSHRTIARIRETTQLLLDLFNIEGKYYIHPLKVFNRYSPTMFLPHEVGDEGFMPVVSSADASKILSVIYEQGLESEKRKLDHWDRVFLQAQELSSKGGTTAEIESMLGQLCSMIIGREKRMVELAKKYFTIDDLLEIKSRMIGTGFIGGKAVGMLLARKILQSNSSSGWDNVLEKHDSFYVGSDVYYTYIVQNGWWKLLMEQRSKEKFFDAAKELMKKMMDGKFPQDIRDQFLELIEYFGQAPIIVRSSSLLEDSFGNVFAGKYESIFCVNQGSPDERLANFEKAIKEIFASTMNKDALFYRVQKGLQEQEEQMALLVQRVSGSHRKKYFFPDLAGVGISYNTYVWNTSIDPKAGMLRLVFGLGTRAVNRVDDDYPRIVALADPSAVPSTIDEAYRFSQHKVDVLDISKNEISTIELTEAIDDYTGDITLFAEKESIRTSSGSSKDIWVLGFKELFRKTDFTGIMLMMLKTLETRYGYPVDIEFTVNFLNGNNMKINLLQCRPLQAKGDKGGGRLPKNISKEKALFLSKGNFMGGSIHQKISRIIYIDAKGYSELPQRQRYDIARLIGKLNWQIDRDSCPTLLIGPGRWGTSTPSLGIPISFSEINRMRALVEVSFKTANLSPEVSFGTHFFQDLVEMDIFYVALFTEKKGVYFNPSLLTKLENRLVELVPEYSKYAGIVSVTDFDKECLLLASDIVSQDIACFIEK